MAILHLAQDLSSAEQVEPRKSEETGCTTQELSNAWTLRQGEAQPLKRLSRAGACQKDGRNRAAVSSRDDETWLSRGAPHQEIERAMSPEGAMGRRHEPSGRSHGTVGGQGSNCQMVTFDHH